MKHHVLITGDRNWTDVKAIRRELENLPPDATIIHGGARGADQLADEIARDLGLKIREFPAEWHRFGRGAGIIRNAAMLKEGMPELVLAFHSNLAESRGTRDMVNRALAAGLCVRVIKK